MPLSLPPSASTRSYSNLEDKPRSGRLVKVPNGSAELAAVRERIVECGHLSMEDAA